MVKNTTQCNGTQFNRWEITLILSFMATFRYVLFWIVSSILIPVWCCQHEYSIFTPHLIITKSCDCFASDKKYPDIPVPPPSLCILRPPALHSPPSQQTNRFNQSDQDPSRGCSGAGHHTGRLLLSPTTTTHQLQAAIRSVPRLLLNVRLTILGWYIYLSRHFKNVVIYKFEICICHRSFRP